MCATANPCDSNLNLEAHTRTYSLNILNRGKRFKQTSFSYIRFLQHT